MVHSNQLRAQKQQQLEMIARQQQLQLMQQQKNGTANVIPVKSYSDYMLHYEERKRNAQRQLDDPTFVQHPTTPLNLITRAPNVLQSFPATQMEQSEVVSFEHACQSGDLDTVRSVIPSDLHSTEFLHHALELAFSAGQVEIARYLLSHGSELRRQTPVRILSAPLSQQIPLFELLTLHGWSTNNPLEYGAALLAKVVTNLPLLRWFLAHGANPNQGARHGSAEPDNDAVMQRCAALEAAAARGELAALHMLLDAGADIKYGTPLHYAAGACSPGTMPRGVASQEFDAGRIPIMALLVQRGADVNQTGKSRLVLHSPIMYAVMAGAVERVKWLLGQGADINAKGPWGSTADYVATMGSDEMKRAVQEGLWIQQNNNQVAVHGDFAIRRKS
ncbi:hypothetical protein N7495_002409 [Penicillium taxi]|uniref:uncharacterized protein n=1 Tax=Penicillium taxi TaxID=168475 RepID=UPI002545788D|nr:uncharacterized protein N7495_002409 [Penicillium taxi]KAJ5901881.1 hypothetical protein N7495_002409 [Penicillium taxi]